MKSIPPTLRNKKRYLVFKLNENMDSKKADLLIQNQIKKCIGTFGYANSGYMFLHNKFDNNQGIFRIDTKSMKDVKMALLMINEKITITGVSGVMKKCAKFIENND